MSVVNERIPVLVSRQEKTEIAKKAKAAGLSMGEYLRRGAKAYRSSSADDESGSYQSGWSERAFRR